MNVDLAMDPRNPAASVTFAETQELVDPKVVLAFDAMPPTLSFAILASNAVWVANYGKGAFAFAFWATF